jgi:hypothetical protein
MPKAGKNQKYQTSNSKQGLELFFYSFVCYLFFRSRAAQALAPRVGIYLLFGISPFGHWIFICNLPVRRLFGGIFVIWNLIYSMLLYSIYQKRCILTNQSL